MTDALVTLLAEAIHETWGGDCCDAEPPRSECDRTAQSLLAHQPLRDALTRGLALTPERLVGSVATLIHNHIGYTGEHLSIHSCACDHIARAWFAALTPEATDAAVR